MATVELPASGVASRRKPARFFFVAMGAFAVFLLALAFVPEFLKFARGTFPIAPVLHIHAAIMAAWIASFIAQAYLGASRRTALHRRFGRYAVAIGFLAWASMIFVEFRAIIVHPLPPDLAGYDWNLPGPYTYLTFPIFLVWAVHERRRPASHKRLMIFALFLSLLAAFQRYLWIPDDRGYAPFFAALDLCLLVPLVGYDLYTLKGRLHPATVRGSVVLTASQALLLGLWGTDLWRNFASSVAHTIHG